MKETLVFIFLSVSRNIFFPLSVSVLVLVFVICKISSSINVLFFLFFFVEAYDDFISRQQFYLGFNFCHCFIILL